MTSLAYEPQTGTSDRYGNTGKRTPRPPSPWRERPSPGSQPPVSVPESMPRQPAGQQLPDMSTYKPNPYVSEGQFRDMFSGGQAQPRQPSFGTPYGWRERPQGQPPSTRQPMGDAMLPPGWSFGPNGQRIPQSPVPAPPRFTPPPMIAQPTLPEDYLSRRPNIYQPRFPGPTRNDPRTATQRQNEAIRKGTFGRMKDRTKQDQREFATYFGVDPEQWVPVMDSVNNRRHQSEGRAMFLRRGSQTQPGGPEFRFFNDPTPQPQASVAPASIDPRQRDAFIQNINDSMIPYYANSGTYLGPGEPPATWGQPPQFDIPRLWNQAGEMVQAGYQNPLAGLFG